MKEINLKRAMELYAEESNDLLEQEINVTLAPVLEAVQKRRSARCIDADDILSALSEVEKNLGISKKAMDGVKIRVDCNAQTFPNAYKYRPESTQFSARYRNGYWRVTDIYRGFTKGPSRRIEVELTDAAKEAIIKRMSAWN